VFHRVDLFPTPKARDSQTEGYEAGLRRSQPQVGTIVKALAEGDERVLMPTPKAGDGIKGNLKSSEDRREAGHYVGLPNVAVDLMPTATASDWKGSRNETSGRQPGSKHHSGSTLNDIAYKGSWGKFEPAIRRWEQTIGRSAPDPTKPDGKDGAHRLSSKFTEWMMGLPDGFITDCGLTRTEELKACGNGVVPQQAELALRLLLQEGKRQ
jgi:DNA (cytosine-5)-methyltransferase 1